MYTSPLEATTAWRPWAMLSANTVAQKPAGSVRPALSPGQADVAPVPAVPAAAVRAESPPLAALSRLLHAVPSDNRTTTPSTGTIAGRVRSGRDTMLRGTGTRATTGSSPGGVQRDWRQVLHRARATRTTDAIARRGGTDPHAARFSSLRPRCASFHSPS